METFSFVSVEKQRFTDHASENTLYTLFQNGHHFVSMQIGPRFQTQNSEEYLTLNEAIRATFHGNKRIPKRGPFWNKVYKRPDTVFTRISAAALISFFAPQVWLLFEGGAYLTTVSDQFTFSIFLFNGTLSIC